MEVAEYEQLVNELETRVDRLRSLYDQYFMGIEKTVPSVPHKDVDRRVQILRREQVRNTGIRFRFQMIVQRYNTYQTYWQRICRQIEEGTYKRHVQKAKEKILKQAAAAKHESGGYEIDVEFEMEMMELEELGPGEDAPALEPEPDPDPIPVPAPAPIAAHAGVPRVGPVVPSGARQTWKKVALGPPQQGQAPPPAPVAPAPAPPPVAAPPKPAPPPAPAPSPVAKPLPAPAQTPASAAAPAPRPAPKPAPPPPKPAAAPPSPGDLSDTRKRELYARYVETKRSRGESTVGITFESLSQTLRDSSAKLREKHGKNVDFEVTVKDGKTILKPILK